MYRLSYPPYLSSIATWMLLAILAPNALRAEARMSAIRVGPDGKSFVEADTQERFVVWGVNYDHDRHGRLIEDYWDEEWATIREDFGEIKALGANTVRIHLQLGKFLDAADRPNEHALARLKDLVALAEKKRLYLDLTGLGCYHKADTPPWYDELSEQGRWDAQALFWRAVAKTCRDSPAIFCYDLMNEPVVPAGKRKDKDWLGPPFAGKHFVQVITLDQAERPRPEIAKAWIGQLTKAIRAVDAQHLITVGLVDWSLDRPGLTSGFEPRKVAGDLDFLAVHLYPASGQTAEALDTLAGFDIGKPLIVEETFPLRCKAEELEAFIVASRKHCSGWVSFYWGQEIEELKKSDAIGDVITAQWLERFKGYREKLKELRP